MRGSINEQIWHGMAAEMMRGMREWRAQHPNATLRQMEDDLDARWAHMRTRMVEDMALASAAADWAATPPDQHPRCPDFSDLHYSEAVRILDFAHAAKYLATIA